MAEPYDVNETGQGSDTPRGGARPPLTGHPPPPPPNAPIIYAAPAPGRSAWSKIMGTLLVISLLLNLYLGAIVYSTFSHGSTVVLMEGNPEQRIAVLPIEGLIDESTAVRVRAILQELEKDPPKALIVRVDSGGGGVGASDRIWHDLVAFKKKTEIPVVASYGSYAASGGYYVSVMADHIIAEPTCITGSIGVMANIVTVDKLLEKIGVTPQVQVATGSPQKDVANNIMRPWTDEDAAKLQMVLDAAHERFVHVVHEGRKDHLTAEQVSALANGNIYTAEQAVANKLIDAEGYLQDAIDEAAKLAKLSDPHVETYVERGFSVALLLGSERTHVSKNGVNLSAVDGKELRKLLIELTTPVVEYRFGLAQP